MRSRRVTSTPSLALGGLLVIALGTTACGEIAEKATETAIEQGAGGGDVDIDLDDEGGMFSVETEDGSFSMDMDEDGNSGFVIETEDGSYSSVSGTEVPDDFPSFVYLPEGIEIVSAHRQTADGDIAYTVFGKVPGDLDDVADDVEATYGVDPDSSLDAQGVRSATWDDVEGFRVSYSIQLDADGVTVMNVSVQPLG